MNEPIRILHILQRMEAAGIQTLLMSIYRRIDRSKIQFDFLVHYKEDQFFDHEIEELGGKVYKLSVREDHDLIKYNKELKRFFKNHPEYKIVHGHMPVLGFFYLRAAAKANVPVRIAHAHTDQHYNTIKGYISYVMKYLYPVYATDCFACSESAGKYIFGKRKFRILKNAIQTDRFIYNEEVREKKRRELGIRNCFVIGHVGRFAEHKNHKFLIEIVSEIVKIRHEAVLLLIGNGELRNQIEKQVDSLDLRQHVRFLGVREDVNELYQAMDAFVFPSIFEGLGIVNIEAQASGVMTFCSDAVPKEANVSPVYTTISLSEPSEKWAKIIIDKVDHREPRRNMEKYIVASGYDISTATEQMTRFYLNKYNEMNINQNK